VTVRHGVIDLDRPDARTRRTLAKGPLESLEALGIPFRLDLHASVGEVADPAVHTFAARGRFSEVSETDALHAAADGIPSRDYGHSATRDIRALVC
jgi:hypothetical protein